MMNTQAVSYTHLDVYKRQVFTSSITGYYSLLLYPSSESQSNWVEFTSKLIDLAVKYNTFFFVKGFEFNKHHV